MASSIFSLVLKWGKKDKNINGSSDFKVRLQISLPILYKYIIHTHLVRTCTLGILL